MKGMLSQAWSALFVCPLLACTFPQTSVSAPGVLKLGSYEGIYVVSPRLTATERRSIPESVYGLGQVDGIYARLAWDQIEPADGHYDWSLLDDQIHKVLRAGKKLSIGIGTGASTPDWLYAEGVTEGTFVVAPHGGRRGGCRTVKLPTPWSPRYQSAYVNLMAALSAHLKAVPGAYSATRIVKFTPITAFSDETRMPASTGGRAAEDGCSQSDASGTWQKLGYAPSKVRKAWAAMAQSVRTLFPDKVIAMSILENNDFPAAAEPDVATASSATATELKRELILTGIATFPHRFSVQWNGLQLHKLSNAVIWAGAQGALVGWQMNKHGPDGAGCPTPSSVRAICTEADFEATLDRGVESGARYIEIWPADAFKYANVVKKIGTRLKQGRLSGT